MSYNTLWHCHLEIYINEQIREWSFTKVTCSLNLLTIVDVYDFQMSPNLSTVQAVFLILKEFKQYLYHMVEFYSIIMVLPECLLFVTILKWLFSYQVSVSLQSIFSFYMCISLHKILTSKQKLWPWQLWALATLLAVKISRSDILVL